MQVKLVKPITGKELFEKYQGKIIEGFKEEEVKKAQKVFDFLSDIKKRSSLDNRILQSWAQFFTKKKIPFVVIEHTKCKKLWKEKIIDEKEETGGK